MRRVLFLLFILSSLVGSLPTHAERIGADIYAPGPGYFVAVGAIVWRERSEQNYTLCTCNGGWQQNWPTWGRMLQTMNPGCTVTYPAISLGYVDPSTGNYIKVCPDVQVGENGLGPGYTILPPASPLVNTLPAGVDIQTRVAVQGRCDADFPQVLGTSGGQISNYVDAVPLGQSCQ
jgi:hypothetical protein